MCSSHEPLFICLFLVVPGQAAVYSCDFESGGLDACGLANTGTEAQLRWDRWQGETPSTFARTGPLGDYSLGGEGNIETMSSFVLS